MIISTAYVQNGFEPVVSDPCSEFDRVLLESAIAISDAKRDYEKNVESLELRSFITESVDKESLYIEAGENFFAKIGKVVLKLAKKFSDMCDKIIQNVKEITFRMKSNEKKIKMLQKEHPEVSKDTIKELISDGGIKIADMKSFAELDNAYYKLMKMAKDKDVDPKSFKGRCKEFEQKIKNHDGKLMTVAAVAGAATTIFGFYKLAATIGRDVKKAKQDVNEMTGETYNKLKEYIGKEKADLDVETMGKMELTLRMHNALLHKKNAAISKNVGVIHKIEIALARAVDKIAGTKAVKSIAGDINANHRADIAALGKEAAKKAREEREENKQKRKQVAAQIQNYADNHEKHEYDRSQRATKEKQAKAQHKGQVINNKLNKKKNRDYEDDRSMRLTEHQMKVENHLKGSS